MKLKAVNENLIIEVLGEKEKSGFRVVLDFPYFVKGKVIASGNLDAVSVGDVVYFQKEKSKPLGRDFPKMEVVSFKEVVAIEEQSV